MGRGGTLAGTVQLKLPRDAAAGDRVMLAFTTLPYPRTMFTFPPTTEPKALHRMSTVEPMYHTAPGPGLVMVKPDSGTKGRTVKKAEATQLESAVDCTMTRRVPGVIKGGTAHSADLVVTATEDVTVASRVMDVVG